MTPTPTVPLPLRNALAALALRAFEEEPAREALAWLTGPRAAPPAPPAAAALVAAGLADPPGEAPLAAYAPHDEHVRSHALRALGAVRAAADAPTGDPLRRALRTAAALWNAGLFFEVHEALEPHWGRARGPAREALQGLIQIAVAFHHLAHGNLRGARTLLRAGRAKLAQADDLLAPIDVAALRAETAPLAAALATRGGPPPTALPPPLRLA